MTKNRLSRRDFVRLGAAGAAVAALAGLTGCGESSTSSTSSDSASDSSDSTESAVAEKLNIAFSAQPDTLDTIATSSNVTVDLMCNVFESLYTLDGEYNAVPMLAEGHEVSDDGLVHTFTLRQGVKFHNGDEMKAADAVACLNRWATKGVKSKALMENAKFEATDDYTLTCTLEEPASDLLIIMATHSSFCAIMPASVIEAAGDENVSEFIGTGPYKFDEWKQDQYVKLVRFDDYVGQDTEASGLSGRKDAPTKELYFRFVTDASTRVNGLTTGEYDIADDVPSENYDEVKDNEELNLLQRADGTLTCFLNSTEGMLAENDKLRQAIIMGIDCEAVSMASYGNTELFQLGAGFMNPSQTQWASDAGSSYYNQHDTERAKKLIEESGYDDEKIVLLTTPDYPEMYNAVVALQQQLAELGLNAQISSLDFSTFMDVRSSKPGEWDLFVASTRYQLIPQQSLSVSTSFYGMDDEDVLAKLADVRSAESDEAAGEAWAEVQEMLYERSYITNLCHYISLRAARAEVEGFDEFLAPVVWNASRPA